MAIVPESAVGRYLCGWAIMHGLDIAILGVITISTVISLVRGFVKEALSLVAWVLAIWMASRFADVAAVLLEPYVSPPQLRFLIGFAGLFVITLFVAAMVNFLVAQLVRRSGISGTDRVVGMLFGVARGGMVVAVMVLLASLTTLPQGVWWQDSQLVGHFEQMAGWMRGELPPEVSSRLSMK